MFFNPDPTLRKIRNGQNMIKKKNFSNFLKTTKLQT